MVWNRSHFSPRSLHTRGSTQGLVCQLIVIPGRYSAKDLCIATQILLQNRAHERSRRILLAHTSILTDESMHDRTECFAVRASLGVPAFVGRPPSAVHLLHIGVCESRVPLTPRYRPEPPLNARPGTRAARLALSGFESRQVHPAAANKADTAGTDTLEAANELVSLRLHFHVTADHSIITYVADCCL